MDLVNRTSPGLKIAIIDEEESHLEQATHNHPSNVEIVQLLLVWDRIAGAMLTIPDLQIVATTYRVRHFHAASSGPWQRRLHSAAKQPPFPSSPSSRLSPCRARTHDTHIPVCHNLEQTTHLQHEAGTYIGSAGFNVIVMTCFRPLYKRSTT